MPYFAGTLRTWPSKLEMAALLQSAGLDIHVGRYSIRINNCEDFSFREYGGDLGLPCIVADAEDAATLERDARLVSGVLARAAIAHSFELYDDFDSRDYYLRLSWPVDGAD